MTTIFTVSFGKTAGTTASAATLYTAPAGKVSVLRDVVLYCGAAGGGTLQLFLQSGSLSIYLLRPTFSGPATEHLELRQCVQPGEQLVVQSFFDAYWSAALTGYQFEA